MKDCDAVPVSNKRSEETHLRVYKDRSELLKPEKQPQLFEEGEQSQQTKARYELLILRLGGTGKHDGLLDNEINNLKSGESYSKSGLLPEEQKSIIKALVQGVTSEYGRAIVALTILQILIKYICPEQSIRLHKGGSNTRDFSWVNGISMRSLDTKYITPKLRYHKLLYINKYGIMMTRTLAENYPYSEVYKAQIKGARDNWLSMVEMLEDGNIETLPALHFILEGLIDKANEFNALVNEIDSKIGEILSTDVKFSFIEKIIKLHFTKSKNAPRLLEIAMHSLYQAGYDLELLGELELVPLSQMRSANKKHKNVGDVELRIGDSIIESWDAKLKKPYLLEELDEIREKFVDHPNLRVAGFVCDREPENDEEISTKISEIEEETKVIVQIVSFDAWSVDIVEQLMHNGQYSKDDIGKAWMRAYAETLSLKREDLAPIDEPSAKWLKDLQRLLNT